MAIIRNTLLVVACCLCASAIAECSADAQHEARSGRKLLARTDKLFQEYSSRYPNKSVMVCKNCNASGLSSADVAGAVQDGFTIWVFCSGTIINNGDGGFDNWQFKGSFTRTGSQGKVVNFSTC